MKQICLIKRGKEDMCHKYDERKIYGSVYAACYIVRRKEKECEKTAHSIARHVTKSIASKTKVTSKHITKLVLSELKKYDKHAAFMYETHRDIS